MSIFDWFGRERSREYWLAMADRTIARQTTVAADHDFPIEQSVPPSYDGTNDVVGSAVFGIQTASTPAAYMGWLIGQAARD